MDVLYGVIQAFGLMRWMFVVPVLTRLYGDSAATDVTRAAVIVADQAMHQYGKLLQNYVSIATAYADCQFYAHRREIVRTEL